jgi:YggT family protein
MSWIPRIPRSATLRPVLDFITDTTDPYLNLFRRFLPPLGAGGMAIDLSPMLGIVVLFVLQALIVNAIQG